ncbi:Endonuclease/exonuclease/phosphatase, partial [Cerioporus squamosus]
MNGANSRPNASSGPGSQSKWMLINQLVRQNRVAVLALQETHVTKEQVDRINMLFDGLIRVYVSPDPTSPTAARGVAFVVNLRIVRDDTVKVSVCVPGRAMSLVLTRRRGTRLNLLNVYAPNVMTENVSFWQGLCTAASAPGWLKPDVVLGDFNLVDDATDRVPSRPDHEGAVQSLRTFVARCELTDGWRARNGVSRAFSYLQLATGSQSRIDRVYVTRDILKLSHSWDIIPPGIPTDHCMVCVSVTDYNEPVKGPGRWRLPSCLLTDKQFLDETQRLGIVALEKCYDSAPDKLLQAAQWRLYEYKEAVTKYARTRAKQLTSKLDRRIEATKEDI